MQLLCQFCNASFFSIFLAYEPTSADRQGECTSNSLPFFKLSSLGVIKKKNHACQGITFQYVLNITSERENTKETCVPDNPAHADRSAPHRLNTHGVFPLNLNVGG